MVKVRSKSVDLDKVYEVAEANPKNALQMLVLYLKIQGSKEKVKK